MWMYMVAKMANAVVGMEFWSSYPYGSDTYKFGDVHGIVTNDKGYLVYGKAVRHYIYFVVLESDHVEYEVGKEYMKLGDRFYKHIYHYTYPPDFVSRAREKDEYKVYVNKIKDGMSCA